MFALRGSCFGASNRCIITRYEQVLIPSVSELKGAAGLPPILKVNSLLYSLEINYSLAHLLYGLRIQLDEQDKSRGVVALP